MFPFLKKNIEIESSNLDCLRRRANNSGTTSLESLTRSTWPIHRMGRFQVSSPSRSHGVMVGTKASSYIKVKTHQWEQGGRHPDHTIELHRASMGGVKCLTFHVWPAIQMMEKPQPLFVCRRALSSRCSHHHGAKASQTGPNHWQ